MTIPTRRANVKILPRASSVAYPFFIATPETIVPNALKTQNMGIVITLTIIGPTIGIAAISAPRPTKSSVNTLMTNAIKTITFLR